MNTLSLREAAEKYDVPKATLSDWVAKDLITVAERPERRGQPMLLDEESVQLAAEHYRAGRGNWNTRDIAQAKSA